MFSSARARRAPRAPRLKPLEASGEKPLFFFFVVALLNIVDSFNLNVVWPMLPFMVDSYGVAANPKDLAAWVGVAGAAVSVGQLLSSYAWGALSDRVGRRPVLLVGMMNSTFSVLVFGTARTYAQCVAGRFLSGLLNGNAGVVKTYVGETTEKTQQATAFSIFAMAFGFASVVAPGVGGFLQRPAERWPGVFGGTLFDHYPFLLPMLCAASLTAIGGVLGFFYAPETASQWRRMEAARRRRERFKVFSSASSEDAAPRVGFSEDDARDDERTLLREDEEGSSVSRAEASVEMTLVASKAKARDDVGDETLLGKKAAKKDDENDGLDSAELGLLTPSKAAGFAAAAAPRTVGDDDMEDVKLLESDEESAEGSASADLGGAVPPPPEKASSSSPLASPRASLNLGGGARGWDKHTVTAMSSYAFLAAIAIGYDEIFPVFAKTSRAFGGLGMGAGDIGAVLIFGGVALVAFQLTIFPIVLRLLGVTRGLRWAALAFGAVSLIAPIASVRGVVENDARRWAVALASQTLKIVTLAVLFTNVIMAVNNSCLNRVKARVNGAATSMAALGRIVSPVVHGVIFSRSLRVRREDLMGVPPQFVVFGFVALTSVALFALVSGLPRRLDQPPREEEGDDNEGGGEGRGGGEEAGEDRTGVGRPAGF